MQGFFCAYAVFFRTFLHRSGRYNVRLENRPLFKTKLYGHQNFLYLSSCALLKSRVYCILSEIENIQCKQETQGGFAKRMDAFYKIVALLGGLAMFLYGMQVMGDGLKGSSGGAMKKVLARVTNRPVMGFLLGMVVTCVIQSSTATIVILVGLVGAGFLSFRQSVGIVLGANVGTAITSQIIRLMDLQAGESSMLYFFKADNLAPLALILGIVLIMFVRRGASRTMGTIACGFGILFMGLMYMNSAVANLQGSVSYLLTAFEDNYFLGFLAGVGVTGVIQSSSAVIGVIQSLASTVGLSFKGIFAVIIGVNIGDCLTTFLVSRIGANAKQIRTTLVHIIYNVFAALLIVLFLFIARTTGLLSDGLWNSILNSGGIANVHCLFRLVPAVLLLPFSGLFANLAERLVPDKSADAEDAQLEDQLKELDPHLVVSPSLALDLTAKLVGNMSDLALHNYTGAVQQIYEFDPQRSKRIDQREHMLDRMTDASSQYVVAVSPHITLERDTKEQNFLLKAITAFERIGDLAVNITDNVYALRDMDKSFSPYAMEELRVVIDAVQKNLDYTVTAYKNDDMEAARQVEPLEEVIDEMIEYLKAQHVDRMTRGLCDILGGIQFQNILSNLERISDQCSDMAVYILERQDEEIVGQEHTYVHNLHHTYDPDYAAAFRSEYDTYFGRIRAIDHRTSPENQNTPSKPAQ